MNPSVNTSVNTSNEFRDAAWHHTHDTERRDERSRFLSESDCRDVLQRLTRFSLGGGSTGVRIRSVWQGYIRWSRNEINVAGEVRDNTVVVERNIDGAFGSADLNDVSDVALVAATRRAERLVKRSRQKPNADLMTRLPLEESTTPSLFAEATYQLTVEKRAAAALALIHQTRETGLMSAGYIEVAAVGMGMLDTFGRLRYFPYTQARYSVTVRDPKGVGSGWAGVDWPDWRKIDATALTKTALEKCTQSRNPVAIEPGRYTTILEPQAVGDFVGSLIRHWPGGWKYAIKRSVNESPGAPGPFTNPRRSNGGLVMTMLGKKVVDERITISADPLDPDLGSAPFSILAGGLSSDMFTQSVYHPATWITHGVLTNLAYDRRWAIERLGKNEGLPSSGAFRMSGGDTSMEEMIETTKRGLLVTRFVDIMELDFQSQLYRGYTRDGLWLIENGKISKPVKNMAFTESILFALNNILQLGKPQRVYNPNVALKHSIPQPTVVPALKIREFSFTALSDAI